MSFWFTKCSRDCFSKIAELCGGGWMISAQKDPSSHTDLKQKKKSVRLQQMCHVEACPAHGQLPEGRAKAQVSPAWATCSEGNWQNNLQALTQTCQTWCSQGWEEQYSIMHHHVELTPFLALLRLQVIRNHHHRGQLALTKSHAFQYRTAQQNLQAPTSCHAVTSVV